MTGEPKEPGEPKRGRGRPRSPIPKEIRDAEKRAKYREAHPERRELSPSRTPAARAAERLRAKKRKTEAAPVVKPVKKAFNPQPKKAEK